MILLLSLFLALVLGFAAHRASLCSVKAVAEIITTRRAYMLMGFIKAGLWVMLLALPLSWWFPELGHFDQNWGVSAGVLLGGLLFGMGAAINGGCAFFTLSRLASGELALLLTLLGMAAGFLIPPLAAPMLLPQPGPALLNVYQTPTSTGLMLWGLLCLLMGYEAWRLLRQRSEHQWHKRVLAAQYRISSGAALLGLSNALLLLLWGGWAYTRVLQQQVDALVGRVPSPEIGLILVAITMFVGMLISSLQRRDFRWTLGRARRWPMHFGGGLLMGFGAAMAPGGNDMLLLYSIPALSPHALPAYAALLLGVALVIGIRRLVSGSLPSVDCRLDMLHNRDN